MKSLFNVIKSSLLCYSAVTASHPQVVTIFIAAESFTDMNKWVFDCILLCVCLCIVFDCSCIYIFLHPLMIEIISAMLSACLYSSNSRSVSVAPPL